MDTLLTCPITAVLVIRLGGRSGERWCQAQWAREMVNAPTLARSRHRRVQALTLLATTLTSPAGGGCPPPKRECAGRQLRGHTVTRLRRWVFGSSRYGDRRDRCGR